jgi:carbon-monoxide dehydrogenase medium subunit
VKPGRFHYHRPTTTHEAVAILGEHGDEAKVLAGGQSLVPMLSLRLASFGHLVDLNRIDDLTGIERSNGAVRIAAMTRQAVAERDATVSRDVPLLRAALPHIGHFQIRNRGTIGGSLAHADPASELPAVAVALDATFELAGPNGAREVASVDFFDGTWSTAIRDDELLSAVRFPVWPGRSGFAVDEVARRRGDFALCGAAVGVTVDGDGAVTRASIALFGVASTPIRAADAERELVTAGGHLDLGAIGRSAAAPLDPSDDIHASGHYRKEVAAVVVQRALERAIQEARA